jgi:hypothetical protein
MVTTNEVPVPVIDRQVEMILTRMEQGVSKEDLAAELGYNNPVSLDNYMRRRHFSYDSRTRRFVPKAEKSAGAAQEALDMTSQAGRAVAMLAQEDADPREVAKKLGFADHHELGAYLKGRGYEWDPEARNYVKADRGEGEEREEALLDTVAAPVYSSGGEVARFLPLLEFLERNKEKLAQLVGGSQVPGQIPRYAVPGTPVTKSVHMMHTLDTLVRDFSREKNVSQRDLFEVALIEFFRRYGYEREVANLLKQG